MSSVSSLTSSPDLYQILQQASGDPSQGTTANGSAAPGTTATSTTTDPEVQGTAKHHHRHGGGGQLQNQIESAVTQALQNSDSSTDPNQIIQNAIANVLKANGSQTGAAGAQSGTSPQTSATPSNGSTTSATEAQQQFTQLLQANGVDAKQFQADLKAAMQDAQGGGSVDFSKVFASFPPGSSVDTNA